jgi:3-oxoadipate enol-lactonase
VKIRLKDITLNCSDPGPSGGTPVIFIHGFPLSMDMWENQSKQLPEGSRGIFYDVRGHGGSETTDDIFTMEFFVDDLIGLMDSLEIKKAVLCGLSMGGYIALRAYERHPDRIGGMLLCDTKSEPDTNDAKIKRSVNIRIIREKGMDFFSREFVKGLFCRKTLESRPDIINHAIQMIMKNRPTSICGVLLALAGRTDTTSVLPAIKCPVCIITGEYDTVTPPSDGEKMQLSIPGAEFHIIPGAGHMSSMENPPEFNNIMASFLAKLI